MHLRALSRLWSLSLVVGLWVTARGNTHQSTENCAEALPRLGGELRLRPTVRHGVSRDTVEVEYVDDEQVPGLCCRGKHWQRYEFRSLGKMVNNGEYYCVQWKAAAW